MKDKGLAWLGLVLLGLIVWACDQETPAPPTLRSRARRALAWLVVESVTAIGWIVDHLAPIDACDDAGAFAAAHPGRPGDSFK